MEPGLAEPRAASQWVQSPYGVFLNPGLDGSLKLEHATKSIISELDYQLIVHILSEVILGAISVHESGC